MRAGATAGTGEGWGCRGAAGSEKDVPAVIKLIGIVIVAVGFAVRAHLLLVVMTAGLVTGLVSGMSFHQLLEEFGRLFVENRYMVLPVILMMPVIGLLERYGLRERAEIL